MKNTHLKSNQLIIDYLDSVFVMLVDEEKRLIVQEIEPGAYLIKTNDIKDLIQDSNTVDDVMALELFLILKDRLKL